MVQIIKSLYDQIFMTNDAALNFLKELGAFNSLTACQSCNNMTNKLMADKSRTYSYYYFCATCKKKTSLTKNTILERFKKPIYIFLRIVYGFSANFDYCQMEILGEISKQTYSNVRKLIVSKIKSKENEIWGKIGGNGIAVQIDETAICRGRIIQNPSSTLDETPGIQWLIGGVEVSESKKIFLEIIPNRTISTIHEVFQRHLNEGTIIITDGYPSYPSAVREFGSEHIIVPHNEGFTNSEGHHTNLVENLWSHLKSEYKIRRGIQLSSMEIFIYEFYFKKAFLKKRSPKNIFLLFKKLINILFI
ncbi:hypothetical protein DMUE_6014 [Dictyocoela muelleri]|nr:hypothetical protein DMUE_6014 [Dictyocoela muelleri]